MWALDSLGPRCLPGLWEGGYCTSPSKRDDGGVNRDVGSGGGETWSDPGSILEIKTTGFLMNWILGTRTRGVRDDSEVFSPATEVKLTFTEGKVAGEAGLRLILNTVSLASL